jgi:hypothetical protein
MQGQQGPVESAILENAAPTYRGGKCRIGKCGIIVQGWKMKNWKMREPKLYGNIAY